MFENVVSQEEEGEEENRGAAGVGASTRATSAGMGASSQNQWYAKHFNSLVIPGIGTAVGNMQHFIKQCMHTCMYTLSHGLCYTGGQRKSTHLSNTHARHILLKITTKVCTNCNVNIQFKHHVFFCCVFYKIVCTFQIHAQI